MHGLRGFSLKRKVQCTNVNRMGVVGASFRIGANHYEMHNKTVAGEYWRRHSPHHVNLTLRRHGVDWLSCLLASCWLVRGATAARTALASSPALSCSSWRDGKWADAVQLDTNRWAPSRPLCMRATRACHRMTRIWPVAGRSVHRDSANAHLAHQFLPNCSLNTVSIESTCMCRLAYNAISCNQLMTDRNAVSLHVHKHRPLITANSPIRQQENSIVWVLTHEKWCGLYELLRSCHVVRRVLSGK